MSCVLKSLFLSHVLFKHVETRPPRPGELPAGSAARTLTPSQILPSHLWVMIKIKRSLFKQQPVILTSNRNDSMHLCYNFFPFFFFPCKMQNVISP